MFLGDAVRPLLKGIDVNQAPAVNRTPDLEEEEAGLSSPNSTVSSVVSGGAGGKRGEREEHLAGRRPNSSSSNGEENDLARVFTRGISDEEDGGDGSRKKLRLSKEQSAVLEESFKEHNTLNPKQKMALAKQLNLRPRQVEVWFQNRRARTKLKQTEVDCEFLKRCCENLTEENRRLQKEVHELRALKLSPQFYMHMTPPTTLTMCPSCERVAVSSSSSSSSGGPVSAVVPSAPPAADNLGDNAGGGLAHHYPQQPLQQHHHLHHKPTPRHLLPAPHMPIPMPIPAAGGAQSRPWPPTPLRS
ncbi:unnamed protein product [Spirodela intermedia]|uniref:Homeobox domain-containing protein n=1 Tax=Spirodela intermedia TaxID=51605 RepID=A0A7I8K609_SPIIN|nr:unnamed protein product [Spirodela intermedia]